MTPEFEKWVDAEFEKWEPEPAKQGGVVFPGPHFWLSRFVAEVEKEATEWYNDHRLDNWETSYTIAANQVKTKFGLGGADE